MHLTTVEVWDAFHNKIRQYILKRVTDPDDAEDILQEVFLKIHNSIGQLENKERLPAWLYRICRNAVIDYYRARRREIDLSEDLAVETATYESDPETELAAGLRGMIGCLPEKYRQALILTELDGMKQAELADHLNLSLSGAKSRVQRGREMLREELLACCHFEFDRRGKIIHYVPRRDYCQNCQNSPTRDLVCC